MRRAQLLQGYDEVNVARPHEVYLENEFGRLRDVALSPDGELYVTTSNCDSRGSCPDDKDRILRIVPR